MCEFIGAIDVETRKFVLPHYLEKEHKSKEYKCIVCDEKLMLKIGEIRIKHFAHYPNSKCILNNSNHNGESIEHSLAKHKLFYLLKNKTPLKILVECPQGHTINYKEVEIKYDSLDEVRMEYKFKNLKINKIEEFIADVAVINSLTKKIKYVFEVCYSHKTDEKTKIYRPEPWFEIKAEEILKFDEDIEIQYKPLVKSLLTPERIIQIEKQREMKIKVKLEHLTCIREIDFDEYKENKVYRFCDICIELNKPWVNKIPQLKNKYGYERNWIQDNSCISCDNKSYSPYFNKIYRQICGICVYTNINKVKNLVENYEPNVENVKINSAPITFSHNFIGSTILECKINNINIFEPSYCKVIAKIIEICDKNIFFKNTSYDIIRGFKVSGYSYYKNINMSIKSKSGLSAIEEIFKFVKLFNLKIEILIELNDASFVKITS